MMRRARCAEHTDVVSEWSDPTNINALESGNRQHARRCRPDRPRPFPDREPVDYTASGCVEQLASRHLDRNTGFDWGDGSA